MKKKQLTVLFQKGLRFALGGGVCFGSAFVLNWVLNENTSLHPTVIYIFVVIAQAVLGFVLNRYFIFSGSGNSLRKQGAHYIVATVLFRVLDVNVYSLLVLKTGVYYLLAQLLSNAAVLGLKFLVFLWIFESGEIRRKHKSPNALCD